ncbi:cytokine receptor family member b2 isoform X2 [Chanodichthys erythropterus]|uniref:cytokine receptor family member b2 isoform X2 n=1 Tax=Chanodichthys erythropterus TaxID=933992 RepID=UPI00351DD3B6
MCVITRTLTALALLQLALCMDIPAPVNLNLSSQYFIHTLSWEMGPGSPDGVIYTVRIRTLDGEVVVKECVNVTSPLRCDLTEALSNVEETYYISVFAALGSQKSPEAHCNEFKPITGTTFEEPLLKVTACNRSLCVVLRAPAERLHEAYNSHRFRYKLLAISEDGTEVAQYAEGLGNETIPDLAPGRRYCVSVRIVDQSTPHRPPVCASIPPSPQTANHSDAVVSVVLFLLMMLLLIFTPRLVTRYFCSKPLPAVLRSVVSVKEVLLITAAEPVNTVCEDRDFLQKIKRNGEETDTEEETEETVKYERIVAQYMDAQDSSPIICPASSSSGLLMIQSPDADPSLTSSTDAQSLLVFEDTTEPTAPPQETSPLLSVSLVSSTHVEDEEESGTDVNLFSVKLGGVSAEPHKAEPDQILSIKDEPGSYPQSLLQTDSHSQTSIGNYIPEGDEEDEECSDYLSRN